MDDSQVISYQNYLTVMPLEVSVPTVCYDIPCTFDEEDDDFNDNDEILPNVVNKDRFLCPDNSQNEAISNTNKIIINNWFYKNLSKAFPTKLQLEQLMKDTDLSSKQINSCLFEVRQNYIRSKEEDISNDDVVIPLNHSTKNIVVKYCVMKSTYLTNEQLSVLFGFMYDNRYNPIPTPHQINVLINSTGLSSQEIRNWIAHAIEIILPDMLHITRRKELSFKCRKWHTKPYKASTPINIIHNRQKLLKPIDKSSNQNRQRLPSGSKNILMDWLQKNHCSPYPSEEVKLELSAASNLSVLQINNWFINARRRYLHKIILKNVSEKIVGEKIVSEKIKGKKIFKNNKQMQNKHEKHGLVVSGHNYLDSICKPRSRTSSISSDDDEDVYQKQLKLTLKALQSKPIVVLERLKM